MKKVIYLLAVSFAMNGCLSSANITKTSGLSENDVKEIPLNSKIIFVERPDSSARKMYDDLVTILLDRGHRITKEDKERFYLITEGKDVGESTNQRMTIFVTNESGVSKAKISTDWKPGSNAVNMASAIGGMTMQADWQSATYRVNRLGIAFAESVSVAKKVKEGKVTYE